MTSVALRACTALFIAIAAAAFGMVLSRARPASRLGLRGLKRQRALLEQPVWRLVEPLVRSLGGRLSGALPDRLKSKLDRQIALAGDALGLTAEEYVVLIVFSGLLGVGFAFVASSLAGLALNLGMMLFIPLALAAPSLQMTATGQERVLKISRELPFAIDLLAMAMSAGIDFPGAVRQVVEKAPRPTEPCIEEFTLLLQGLSIGRSRREVLEELAARAPCEAVTQFTSAVIQAEQRGNPLAEVLRIQATAYRTARSVKGEESAAKAAVQMTGPLLLVFISVMLLVLGPMIVQLGSME